MSSVVISSLISHSSICEFSILGQEMLSTPNSIVMGCDVSLLSLDFMLLFVEVMEALLWRAPILAFQERFRIGSGYLRLGFLYWRRLCRYIIFVFSFFS